MSKDTERQRENLENINDLNDQRITAEKQLFKVLQKNSKELEASDKKHIKAMDLIVKSQRSFKTLLGETKDLVKDTVGIFVSWNFATDILNAAKGVVAMEKSLYRASINAGKTAEEGKKVVGIAAEMRMKFGATAEDAEKVLKTFVKGQYKGNIREAADASYQFARAMDLDKEAVAKNTLELQKWGQIGPKAATAMYADIMKIAQGYGLTSEGAEGVIKATTKLSGYMRAFGKSETDIQKMNLGLAKMVSSMEKVGVSAQDALAIVEQLLDPERIEENIPAYAALGISITDAINGNIDSDQITSGMKEIGNRLKEMGPIAGAAYAKAMGISYKNAIKSADLDQITEEAMTPQETAVEQMKQMTENTKNLTEKINDFINKIQGAIQSLGPVLMVVLGGIAPKIFIKIGKKLFNSIKENMKNGTEEGAKKGADKAEKMLLEIQNKKREIKIDTEINLERTKKKLNMIPKSKKMLIKEVTTTSGRKAAEELKSERFQEAKKTLEEKVKLEREHNALVAARAKAEAIKNEISLKGKNITEEEGRKLKKAYKDLSMTNDEFYKQEEQLKKINKKYDEQKASFKEINKILKETAEIPLKQTFKEAFEEAKSKMEELRASNKNNKSEAKKISNNFLLKLGSRFKEGAKTVGSAFVTAGRKTAEILNKVKLKVAKVSGNIAGSAFGQAISMLIGVFKKLAGPIGIVIMVITAVMAILKKNEKIQKLLAKVTEKINDVLKAAVEPLAPVFETLINIIIGIIDKLKPLIDVAVTIIKIVVQVLAPIFEILAAVLEPLMPILEILTGILNMALEILKIPLMIIVGWIKVITLPMQMMAKGLSWLVDKIMPPVQKFLHDLVQKIIELISKLPFVEKAMANAVGENTEAVEENTEAATETKAAQIKRNSDGTLYSTMATVKSEESSGASSQNTTTEVKTVTIADNELKKKLGVISEQLTRLSIAMERKLMFDLNKQQGSIGEDKNLKMQSRFIEQGVKKGLSSIGTVDVRVINTSTSAFGTERNR